MMACACVEKLQSLCLRLKVACRHCCRVGKSQRRSIKISDPFDFKHISDVPEGLNQDEINVLREKAAASRMVAIEDQPSSRPCSRNGDYHHHLHHHHTAFGVFGTRPQPQVKSRAGYRGLASSSAANAGRGLSYAALTESRPSITHSFAAIDDSATAGSLSPTSSIATTTTMNSAGGRQEMRGLSI
ncbi:hypothetical protein M406DRAFT_321401 [Cryphonectria parasitica EP155]|uniref:Uncharacterized protein n=1 Tax=Cryphonectria parasitica (strain ATCC 38755 / EP155) TaxID=660469 RepID=A0A9P5CQW8_CRYP1|nr:uncharacterized protein M406DRAFT_321401 [Cryphonectria parasitica EP155]KAF3766907.1 hypothetical protein M406DRAFT_321401 [Cryphonectria parasitica EP155]